MTIGLLTPSKSYKPTRYPWALEACRQQHRIHWMPDEIPLGEDIRDWSQMPEAETSLLTNVFRLFTQMDVEVMDNYMMRYGRIFRPTEIGMMLQAFAGMETVHVLAYALLLETIGMPESEFSKFLEYDAMKSKIDYMQTFGMRSHRDIAKTLAMFGGATEGLQLYAQFAMLLSFPRRNKMKGMGQIVSWSVRDESLHCEGILMLFRTFVREAGLEGDREVQDDIHAVFSDVVRAEDKFIDLAFEAGPVEGLEKTELKAFTRFIADWRLRQMRLPEIFGGGRDSPIPWFNQMVGGVEHANFFEARATEYSKAATKGSWYGAEGVWSEFDARGRTAVTKKQEFPDADESLTDA